MENTDKQAQIRALVNDRNLVLSQAHSLARKESISADEVDRLSSLTDQLRNMNDEIKNRETQSLGRASRPEVGVIEASPKHEYSMIRAIRSALENKPLDGLEGEISQEMCRSMGRTPSRQGGFFMPYSTRSVLSTSTGVGALSTVTTSDYITLLRNKSLLGKVKTTELNNLVGVVRVPRQTGAAGTAWLSEGSVVAASSATLDYVQLSPRNLACNSVFTRQFLMQSSLDVEAFVLQDITTSMARELDRVILNGGSGQEPIGILNNSAITTNSLGTNGGFLSWNSVVGCETTVEGVNGVINEDARAYVTSSKGLAQMKTIAKISGYPTFLYNDENRTVNSLPIVASNSMSSTLTKGTTTGTCTGLVYGDFSQLLIGSWMGGLEIYVDPYSQLDAGNTRIVCFHTLDVQVRHPESFVKVVDVLTV